jgi:hypothetical protein
VGQVLLKPYRISLRSWIYESHFQFDIRYSYKKACCRNSLLPILLYFMSILLTDSVSCTVTKSCWQSWINPFRKETLGRLLVGKLNFLSINSIKKIIVKHMRRKTKKENKVKLIWLNF